MQHDICWNDVDLYTVSWSVPQHRIHHTDVGYNDVVMWNDHHMTTTILIHNCLTDEPSPATQPFFCPYLAESFSTYLILRFSLTMSLLLVLCLHRVRHNILFQGTVQWSLWACFLADSIGCIYFKWKIASDYTVWILYIHFICKICWILTQLELYTLWLQ